MKIRGHIAVLVATSIFCLYGESYAQEDGFPMPNVDNEPASNATTAGENSRGGFTIDPVKKSAESKEADKSDITPIKAEEQKPVEKAEEIHPVEKPQTEKSTNTNTPATKKPNEAGEDVLSFNLLYYMIQKFKFSDVIDE